MGRMDELADRYGDDMEGLVHELDGIDIGALGPIEREAWYHLRGIAEVRRGDHERAMELFLDGVKRFPASGPLHLSLGCERERIGDVAGMAASFVKADVASIGPRSSLMVARYLYLWDMADAGISRVGDILAAYNNIGSIDETFLYVRGFPTYYQTFGYLAVFARMKGREDIATENLLRDSASFGESVDRETMEAGIDLLFHGDHTRLEGLVRGAIDRDTGTLGPMGELLRLQLALVQARAAGTLAEAEGILGAVELSGEGFAWLEDALLLGRLEAHMRSSSGEVDGISGEFFRRQPLLFEPNLVFQLGFYDVGEALKERYRKGRMAG